MPRKRNSGYSSYEDYGWGGNEWEREWNSESVYKKRTGDTRKYNYDDALDLGPNNRPIASGSFAVPGSAIAKLEIALARLKKRDSPQARRRIPYLRGRLVNDILESGVTAREDLRQQDFEDLEVFLARKQRIQYRRELRAANREAAVHVSNVGAINEIKRAELRTKYGVFSPEAIKRVRAVSSADRAGGVPYKGSYGFIKHGRVRSGQFARPYKEIKFNRSDPARVTIDRFVGSGVPLDLDYLAPSWPSNISIDALAGHGLADIVGPSARQINRYGVTETLAIEGLEYYKAVGVGEEGWRKRNRRSSRYGSGRGRTAKKAQAYYAPPTTGISSERVRDMFVQNPWEAGDPYKTWLEQEDYAFRTGKFAGGEMAERASLDRNIKNRMRGLEKEFGYYYGDPRLDIELRFGLTEKGIDVVTDIETIPTGRGYRPFNMSFGRIDDLSTGRFATHADVYMPPEMIYRDEIMKERLKAPGDRDLNLLSREGLKRRFAADYIESQRRMGIAQSTANRKLGTIMAKYDELWAPGTDMFNINIGEDIHAWWKQFGPIKESLKAGNGRLNLIGQNPMFDIPVIERTIQTARNKIEGILNPMVEAGEEAPRPRVFGPKIQQLRDMQLEMDEVLLAMGGDFPSKTPGALRTDIRGYTSSKEWFAFLRTKTQPFIDIIHSPTSSTAEISSATRSRDAILARLKRMNMGGVSQADAIEMLGVKGLEGFSHTGGGDIEGVRAILQRMSEIPEFGTGTYSEAGLVRNLASALSGRKEDVRTKLADRVNKAIQGSGKDVLPIGAGRLRGTYISRMTSRGKGRFLLDTAATTGKGFIPEELVSSGLWKKFQEVLARPETDAERKFVMQELSEGFFASPKRIDTMMKIYARGRGRHGVKRLMEATRKHSKTLASELMNPKDLMEAISLEGKSPAEALALMQEQTIKNAKSAFAKSVVYIPSSFKETDADRVISKAAGGLKPLEDLRNNVRSLVRKRAGITGRARTDAVKLADLMSDEIFIRMMFNTMKTGIGGAGEGISALVRGEPARALAGRIGFEEGSLMRLGYHDMLDEVIKTAIAGDGSIQSAQQIEAFKSIYSEILQQGYTEFPWQSKIGREALDMLMPDHVMRFGLSNAAQQSASAELARVAGLGYMEGLGKEIAESAFRAGTKPKGVWSIANALRTAKKGTEFFFNNNPEAEQIAGLLRSSQGSLSNKTIEALLREAGLSEVSERAILDLASGVSRVTAENYDLAKIAEDFKFSNVWSLNMAESIENAEPLIDRIEDVHAFDDMIDSVDKGIFGTKRSAALQHLQFLLTDNESEKTFLKATSRIMGPKMGPVARRTRAFLAGDAGLYFLEALTSSNEELLALGSIPQAKIDDLYKSRIIGQTLRKVYRSIDNEVVSPSPGAWSGMGVGEWQVVETTTGKTKRMFQAAPPGEAIRQIDALEDAIIQIKGLSPDAARANRVLDTSIIEESLRESGMRIERTAWTNVPGEWFGVSGELAARTRTMPDYAFIGDQGTLLSEGRQVIGPRGQKLYVGRNAAGEMVPAVQLGIGEREFGFFKNMGVGDYFTQLSENMRTINASEFDTVMEEMNIRGAAQGAEYANESVLDMMLNARRRERGGTETLVEDMSQKSRFMKTVSETFKKMPGSWKVLAAGVAGAAAITMMRRDRPLTPEDSMAYGGFPGGNAYPMGTMPVGPVNTFYAPPAASGMRASISGVVGPEVNVGNLQSLVGSMGFANINVNDNSSSISRREIDQMISSRL